MFDDAVFDTALDDGPDQQAVAESETQAASPKEGMAAHITWNRKQPEKLSQACKVINTKLHWLRLLLP